MDINLFSGGTAPRFSYLLKVYEGKKDEIENRIKEFIKIKERGDDREIFKELLFCILTPQSKAKVSWRAILELEREGLIDKPDFSKIREIIKGVRFRNTKAQNIVIAIEKYFYDGKFSLKNILYEKEPFFLREFLINDVRGYGLKEASHFLRNTGFGLTLSILDRHILKNLKSFGVIDEIPSTLTKRRYYEIEKKMRDFSRSIGIPFEHLDLIFWYNETGEIFK